MFLAAKNLVSDALEPCIPWEFKPVEEITPQIREVKEDRQNFYKNPATQHQFYTGIEPLNPNLRVNRESNPPLNIWYFVADYDIHVPLERIREAIAGLKIKPAWIEISLGKNFRLVWTLPFPIRTASHEFTVFVLQAAKAWLNLSILPGLDEKAFETATRLYCNGCEWIDTGYGAVSERETQSFFVECGKKFRFKAPDDDAGIPLDVVEAGLKKKFPEFSWPGVFELESQGPSFWVPGSVSPQSAIVKAGGMFTFAAHADKPFYPWSAILGEEFVKEVTAEAITKATKDCYYDGKNYYRLREGIYIPESVLDFVLHLRGDCGLSTKPGSSGLSPVDIARLHIHNHNGIECAAPFVFRRPGPMIFMNERRLNTYSGTPVLPAPEGEEKWGPDGNFPFLSEYLDTIFDPREPQLWHFLAWWKRFYLSALNWAPEAGHYMIWAGGVGVGKTFGARGCVGQSVGGFVDASSFLVGGNQFNSHLYKCGLWSLDDDTPNAANHTGRAHAAAMFKKMTGNQEFEYSKKFAIGGMIQWMGRIFITTNLDFTSMKIIGSLDSSYLDKLQLMKCVEKPQMKFPTRAEQEAIVRRELPHFLRWLLNWTIPAYIAETGNNRFGPAPYHNPYLLERTHQGSAAAPFKELLLGALKNYFVSCEGEIEYTGTATEIYKLMGADPTSAGLMRTYKAEQINRYLEQLEKEQLIPCTTSADNNRCRTWTFKRPDDMTEKPAPAPLNLDKTNPNPFSK